MKNIIKYLPAVLWSAFIFTLCFMPGDDIPKYEWLQRIHFDKIMHGSLYCIFFLLMAWPMQNRTAKKMIVPFLVCVAQGVLIEFIQGSSLISGRSFEAGDMLANSLGALLGFLMVVMVSRRSNNSTL